MRAVIEKEIAPIMHETSLLMRKGKGMGQRVQAHIV